MDCRFDVVDLMFILYFLFIRSVRIVIWGEWCERDDKLVVF